MPLLYIFIIIFLILILFYVLLLNGCCLALEGCLCSICCLSCSCTSSCCFSRSGSVDVVLMLWYLFCWFSHVIVSGWLVCRFVALGAAFQFGSFVRGCCWYCWWVRVVCLVVGCGSCCCGVVAAARAA